MEDLEFYKTWCLVIINFTWQKTIESDKKRVNHEEACKETDKIFKDIKKRIQGYYKKGSLSLMRRSFTYINELVPEPGDPDYPILDARLLAACGKGLDDLYKKRWERIAKIKERGKLRSDSEFYLINEHMDYLINMGAPDEETELFDSMLFDYEERARKRREKREKQEKDKS